MLNMAKTCECKVECYEGNELIIDESADFTNGTPEEIGDSYSPEEAPNGVYILHTNGKIYPRNFWKTSENANAVGVAVKTSKCAFVISPDEQPFMQWGSYGTFIMGCVTTNSDETKRKDYEGKSNTDAIIAQLGEEEDYAAKYCRNYTFKNGAKGYLPASGELYEAYLNKSEIDACMSLIGGQVLYDSSIDNWGKISSTQFDANYVWGLRSDDGSITTFIKDWAPFSISARPFAPLL